MSGLCGWFAAPPDAVTLDRMAAPIGRYERTPLKSASAGRAAVALAGSIDCTSLFHEDGLIVALWGSPGQSAARLAARWRSHGVHACAGLAGHFAFAILDERAGAALLAVDRFATRPLFYQAVGGDLLFASSQDALLRHPQAARTVSPASLHDYLVLGSMGASAWEGQHRLGPGQCLHLHGGRATLHTWWRMRFREHVPGAPALQRALEAALDAGVHPAQGTGKLGVMHSGGTASSALAAYLDTVRAEPVDTFSVAYAGVGTARPAAPLRGSVQHTHIMRPADLVDAIPKLAALADAPCGASSAVAHYYCATLARAHGVLRLANGAGVNALFGAGPFAVHQRAWARYGALPAPLRELLVEPLLVRLGATDLADQARRDVPARIVHASVLDPARAAHVLDAGFLAQIDPAGPLAQLRRTWWGAQCRSDVNRTIALDLLHALPAHLAAGSLGCALAGVDVAYPWLEEAVVDCAARTAPRLKHPGRAAPHARALRAMAARADVGAAPAPAAALPLAAWLRDDADLRALAFDSLHDLRRRHVVAGGVIDALLSTALAAPGPGFGTLVWRLMMLEQWFVYRAPHAMAGGAGATSHGAGAPCHAADPHETAQSG